MTKEEMIKRTKRFPIDIIDLVEKLPSTIPGRVIDRKSVV